MPTRGHFACRFTHRADERASGGERGTAVRAVGLLRSPVSRHQCRPASTRAILFPQKHAVAREPRTRRGRSGGRGVGVCRAPGAGEDHLGRRCGPRYPGRVAGQASAGGPFNYGGQFFEQSLSLVNLFAFLDLDPASVPGSLRRPAGATYRSLPATIDSIEFRHVEVVPEKRAGC